MDLADLHLVQCFQLVSQLSMSQEALCQVLAKPLVHFCVALQPQFFQTTL
jgi:hypothetical protein